MPLQKTVAFTQKAVNVFFHILTQCNLRCRHCYINPVQHGRQRLPIDTIEAWLALFADRNKNANVIFLGGEPTLHPDLAPAVHHARQLGYQSITIDTNGYLFNNILDKVTLADVDFFSFSLDGPTAAINDPIRGEGSYRACLAGMATARARGFSTSLIYTVSSVNIDALPQMLPLLKKMDVTRFFIQVIGIRGRCATDESDTGQVTRERWQQIVPSFAREVARAGIVTVYPKVFLAMDEKFECAGVVADNLFIFPNGRVYRCPLCEDYDLNTYQIEADRLVHRPSINESDLFSLTIPEGCVMNRLIQPDNLQYTPSGKPAYQIACCLLKEEVSPLR
jgi:MoaA/NifB/PqqE/SkfB family radical SAM enzyme